jgi:diaminopimelate epimerase
MKLYFSKYQGTGNDFVIVDNRQLIFPKDQVTLIEKICDRRFGVGADGLILLENDSLSDFKMVYFNADGHESSMCGNGGRCIVSFANQLGIVGKETTFNAIDGLHHATLDEKDEVALKMIDVNDIVQSDDYLFLNTGSPHHVEMVQDLSNFDVYEAGKRIRYNSDLYGQAGTNANFVEKIDNENFRLRTYERGVEDETLSCGTGATAVAIAMHYSRQTIHTSIKVQVEGGILEVSFQPNTAGHYREIFLKGPATFVFKGEIIV